MLFLELPGLCCAFCAQAWPLPSLQPALGMACPWLWLLLLLLLSLVPYSWEQEAWEQGSLGARKLGSKEAWEASSKWLEPAQSCTSLSREQGLCF